MNITVMHVPAILLSQMSNAIHRTVKVWVSTEGAGEKDKSKEKIQCCESGISMNKRKKNCIQ